MSSDLARLEVIAIGASTGAIDACNVLLPALAPGARVAVAVVVHIPPDPTISLARLFAGRCAAPLKEAEDKEPVKPGHIYFAPPGYHLLVEPDRTFSLSVDEPVHHSRPSIDVLFESVAQVYGMRAMGVILTGANADGAAGLAAIAAAGGLTVVESPDTARASQMPAAALDRVRPWAVQPLAGVRDLLRTISELP